MGRLACATYGPLPGNVGVERLVGGAPEVLDSAATIARRTIELPDSFENAGAMLLRSAIREVHERVGDGTALVALLTTALVAEANRWIEGGCDLRELRAGLEAALADALVALRQQARPVDSPALLRVLMGSLVRDPSLAALLTEVVDAVGAEGVVMVEAGQGTETTREYLDGVRWNEGFVSPYFATDGGSTVRVVEPAILLTDQSVTRPEQLVPCLEACVGAHIQNLVVVAPEVSSAAVGLLLANRDRGAFDGVLAVRAPGLNGQRTAILEDLAVMTGGECVRADACASLEQVRVGKLGRARQVWANASNFAVLGARGTRSSVRDRAAGVRKELAAVGGDGVARRVLQQRLGNLAGTAALIRVAASSDLERDERRLEVEAAVRAGALALLQGVVAGGGAALAACGEAVARGGGAQEQAGRRLLARALKGPMRHIAARAGLDPGIVLAEARRRGPDWSFDALRNEWVLAPSAGPLDAYAVIATALEVSVSAAISAMSVNAVISRRSS